MLDIATPYAPIEPPAPTQPLVERLLNGVEAHVRAETDSIEAYRAFADTIRDPQLKLVMGLIVEDEERHHELLRRILTRLNNDVYWQHDPAALPTSTSPAADNDELALGVTRAFLHEELHSVRILRDLSHNAQGVYGGLMELLLDWMALDSQKHERALRFVRQRLEQRT
jgi:rubrerythrin